MDSATLEKKTPTARRFVVKGINDDRDFCECCGRKDLKRVVWIEDTETLKLSHFGTVCASAPAKAFGLKKEIAKAIRDFDAAQEAAETARRNAEYAEKVRAHIARRDALYLSLGGTYHKKEAVLRPGYFFTIASDKELFERCDKEVALKQ